MSSLFSEMLKHAEEEPEVKEFDVAVIGAGIAGMEASLDLADMGYSVLLIEKEPTVGGKMFLLSKVFPTLDCASCISTPKMAAVAHHPKITLWTYTEVLKIKKLNGTGYELKVIKKPRFVDESLCTGCYTCEEVCPIDVPKELDFNLRARRAAYIPFDTAVPKVAVIDIDNCIFCGKCERECPVQAINFLQKPKIYKIRVKSIILATGFNLFQAEKKEQYGYGKIPNVITSMQMERLLSPTRPFNHVLRPMDGKEPASIGYVLCTGSRDKTVGNPFCSQVCCMYSIKQAQLILGALPLADVTIYYMDIRAYGKGFEEFYNQALAMGVKFVHGRVAKVEKGESGSVIVKYENIDEGGRLETSEHDLLVLSVGLIPNTEIAKAFEDVSLSLDEFGWLVTPDPSNPVKTNLEGVFAAGCLTGPKDIPDTVVQAASAAAECAAYLNKVKIVAEER